MKTLKLEDFPSISEKWWNEYYKIDGEMWSHKGFRDYIEKTNTGIKVDGRFIEGITITFETEKDAIMFALRWV